MDTKELKKIAKQMRLLGITHLKTNEFELTMTPEAPMAKDTSPSPEPKQVKDITEEEHKEIKHTMDNIKSLMLGSDEDLIARMWPDLAPEQESA